MTKHPHAALLAELTLAIQKMPAAVPSAERERLLGRRDELLKNPEAGETDISAAIADAGRVSWPYRKALEELISLRGREQFQREFIEHLDEKVRKKYTRFAEEHKSEREPWRHGDFETDFSPDEKFQIEEALVEARLSVLTDIEKRAAGDLKKEHDDELKRWQAKQAELAAMILELRALADRSPEWASEILDKVRIFEEGWAVVERDVDPRIVRGEIDYYRDLLEV